MNRRLCGFGGGALLFLACDVSWGETNSAAAVTGGVATISPENTKIQFVCAHVGAKPDPRKGGFGKFNGKAVVDGKALKSVSLEIDTASLFTEFDMLTTHLKSPDFFEVRRFPTARFESTKIESGAGG